MSSGNSEAVAALLGFCAILFGGGWAIDALTSRSIGAHKEPPICGDVVPNSAGTPDVYGTPISYTELYATLKSTGAADFRRYRFKAKFSYGGAIFSNEGHHFMAPTYSIDEDALATWKAHLKAGVEGKCLTLVGIGADNRLIVTRVE